MSLACAKAAAVLSVVYAGVNVYQLTARLESVREKARLFAAVAGGEGASGRLRFVRALFYLAAPLFYLWALVCADLPGLLLIAAGLKFWMSSFLGIRTEQRLLRGMDYEARDHAFARLDAALNIALAAAAVWWILRVWT